MSYTAEISRRNPGCVLILLDQSGSMRELLSPNGTSKAQAVVDVINNVIAELINRNTNGEEIFDRLEVGVITYGGAAVATPLSDSGMVSLSHLSSHLLRLDTRQEEAFPGAGPTDRREVVLPVWFDPACEGKTPMCLALDRAHGLLQAWTLAHPASYPPILVNITDGEASDGDPSPMFQSLKSLATQDGPVLVMNVLITQKVKGAVVSYPSDAEEMWDEASTALFLGSSALPDALRAAAENRLGRSLPGGARAVVLNAGMVDLIQALDIGTRLSA